MARPLFLIALFFILTTFLAYFTQGSDWQRFFGLNLHRILELVDLRWENTLATWFSSMLFLAVGLSFVLLGWGYSPAFTISRWTRFVFQLTAIGAVLLSADEVASFHETAGKWFKRVVNEHWSYVPPDNQGYSWIILFAPVLLGGFLALVYFLRQVIATMPLDQDKQRQWAYLTLLVAFVCLPGVLAFEVFEWWLASFNQGVSILTCFEELFELMGMYSLFLCAVFIARQYQL